MGASPIARVAASGPNEMHTVCLNLINLIHQYSNLLWGFKCMSFTVRYGTQLTRYSYSIPYYL